MASKFPKKSDKEICEELIAEEYKRIESTEGREGEKEGKENYLGSLLQKKYVSFILRKLRVGNKETIAIISSEKTIKLLLSYLNDNENTPNHHGTTKSEELQEVSQMILSSGRKEIVSILVENSLISDSFETIISLTTSRRSLSPGFSFHFSKVLISLLEYHYQETATYLNEHPLYLTPLSEFLDCCGIPEIFLELFALNLKPQLTPKISWLSVSCVSSLLDKISSQLDLVIRLKNPPPLSDNQGLEVQKTLEPAEPPSFDSILSVLIYLLDSNPDLSHPLFSFDNLSNLVRKIIEADVVYEFYSLLQKLLEMNLSWIKKSNSSQGSSVPPRARFTTSSSFSNFGSWTNFTTSIPSFQQPQTPLTASLDLRTSLYTSSSFLGESSIPICVFENGELIPIVLKVLLISLPRLKYRLFRYHPTIRSTNPKTFKNLQSVSQKEEDLFSLLKKELNLQQAHFKKQKEKREKNQNNSQDKSDSESSESESDDGGNEVNPNCQGTDIGAQVLEIEKTLIDPHATILDSEKEPEEQERLKREALEAAEEEEQIIMVVVPLGLQRWAIIRLVLQLLVTGYHSVDDALVESRILSICLRLFLSHNSSNLLHCTIVEILHQIFEKNHLKIIHFLVDQLNLPIMLIEAYQTLPPPTQTDFATFREHLLIAISLLARENKFAQNLLSGNERWRQFTISLQPRLDSIEVENFYKKNSHRVIV